MPYFPEPMPTWQGQKEPTTNDYLCRIACALEHIAELMGYQEDRYLDELREQKKI